MELKETFELYFNEFLKLLALDNRLAKPRRLSGGGYMCMEDLLYKKEV
jgi:hypothetical protein